MTDEPIFDDHVWAFANALGVPPSHAAATREALFADGFVIISRPDLAELREEREAQKSRADAAVERCDQAIVAWTDAENSERALTARIAAATQELDLALSIAFSTAASVRMVILKALAALSGATEPAIAEPSRGVVCGRCREPWTDDHRFTRCQLTDPETTP